MLEIRFNNRMKRDIKLMKKLEDILTKLAKMETLSEKNKNHQLIGEWKDFRECHIEPDWLLIYKIENKELILFATATGSHSDLFC